MQKFCESFKEHAKNKIIWKEKKMLSLTREELKAYQDAKVWDLSKNNL